MMATNLDYDDGFNLLGTTLRNQINMPSRVHKTESLDYVNTFQGQEYLAQLNNKRAKDIGSGYTFEVNSHNLMSGVAPRLLEILVSKIVSTPYIEGKDGVETNLLKLIKPNYITKQLYKAFNMSLSTGRAAMVVDYNDNPIKVGCRVFDGFRVKVYKDAFDNVSQVDLYISKTENGAFERYFVIERRYFNKDGKPCQKFILTKTMTNDENGKVVSRVEYDDIKRMPQDILNQYSNVRWLTEIELADGYANELGVYFIDNTMQNKLFPYTDIPESQFLYVQDLLTAQDVAFTNKEVDKENGRGRVLIKEFQKSMMGIDEHLPSQANVARSINMGLAYNAPRNRVFMQYPQVGMQEQAPINVQFDMRTEQWRTELGGNVGDICAAFGVSVLDYDPRLLVAGQRTDDEINAMTDITRQTVEEKRALAKGEIDAMLNCMARLYGLEEPVFLRWSLASILNPTKNIALITAQLQNGTISQEEAIKRSNPDYTKAELDEELKRILNDQEKAQANEVASGGGFEF